MNEIAPVFARIDAGFEASVERLRALLRIPSVGTDPAYAAETRRAGQFMADQLAGLGFRAELRDTAGHPMVVAHSDEAPAGTPHLLYYGHYDVQPPDPLDLWTSPPFEPTIVEGPHGPRLVARGAVDDKGQTMTFVEAFRAWRAEHGRLPVRVTVLLEGEEESGSPSLPPFLAAHRDELRADVCIVSDTNAWDIDTPAITTMLRGLVYVEVTLHGPSRDLHSGMYGGAVPNPVNLLARMLGDLHDTDGRCNIPGFYDDVLAIGANQRAQWAGLGFDERAFLGEVGVAVPVGEAGFSTLERIWARPSCDLNGIFGGYTGAGAKTVIASHAMAKLSCRLVPDQDPDKIVAGIRAFLDARLPPGCRYELTGHGASPAIRIATESPYLNAAAAALRDVYGRDPVLQGCGGSIPVVGWIRSILGFDSILMGFGLDDDRIHSPNEKFELKCFERGIKSHAALLARLAGTAWEGNR